MAVPSSSVKPSARRSTTRPPTRTSRPDHAVEVDEVGVGRRRGPTSRRPRRAVGPLVPPAAAPVPPACVEPVPPPRGGRLPSTRTSAGNRGVTAKRRSVALGYGRRAIPTTVALRPSTSAVLAMPAPGWPTTTTLLVADHDLRRAIGRRACGRSSTRPVIATSRHSCATPGCPWRTRGAGAEPLPRRRRGDRPAAAARRRRRRSDRRHGPGSRPGARSRRSAAGPRPRPRRPGRRSDARSSRAGVAGAVTMASIATSRSVILSARAIDTVAGDPAPGLDLGEPGPPVGDGDARWARHDRQVGGVADPDPVSVEGTGPGRPLADEPDDPIRRADLERRSGDPAGGVGHDLDRRSRRHARGRS